jgi:hypothetical protein
MRLRRAATGCEASQRQFFRAWCAWKNEALFAREKSSRHHLAIIFVVHPWLMKLNRIAQALSGLLLMIPSCEASAPWRMKVIGEDWHLAAFEESLDLSCIASADMRHCLVGSDESFYIQPGVIDSAALRIESRRPMPLIPTTEADKNTEIDIEGVAWSVRDASYYITGSHGLGKKKGDLQPARNTLFKIPFLSQKGDIDRAAIRRASLLPLLEKIPETAAHLRKPLQHNGLNIEGLTVSDGRLYFGLRAPNIDGRGFIISVDPASVFDGADIPPRVHALELGKGRGIRELAAIRDGFLIITGNASAEASKKIPETQAPGPDDRFEMLHWNPGDGSRISRLGELPRNGGKAEGILILEESAAAITLIVLYDGLQGGAPVTVRLERR